MSHPPSERLDDAGPRFYAAGPYAHDLARLAKFGLDVSMLDGPIGAASGLKLSYARISYESSLLTRPVAIRS